MKEIEVLIDSSAGEYGKIAQPRQRNLVICTREYCLGQGKIAFLIKDSPINKLSFSSPPTSNRLRRFLITFSIKQKNKRTINKLQPFFEELN